MSSSPALEFRKVRFRYPSESAAIVDGLSFQAERGEFVSVIGPSGCGKSTIFRLVNRLLEPAEGEIFAGGETIRGRRGYCGYMPQQDLLFPWRTVEENVRLPMEIQGGRSRGELRERAARALESVGLAGWGDKTPRELSGGMRQRAAFARTLMTGAKLLLLDEPFSALDYLTRLGMREWLLEQWERERKTVLFITHDVEEAIFLSTRILVADSSPISSLRSFSLSSFSSGGGARLSEAQALELKKECIALLTKRPAPGEGMTGDVKNDG